MDILDQLMAYEDKFANSELSESVIKEECPKLLADTIIEIETLRKQIKLKDQLIQDFCDDEDEIKRLLAKYDKSDSYMTYSPIQLVECVLADLNNVTPTANSTSTEPVAGTAPISIIKKSNLCSEG